LKGAAAGIVVEESSGGEVEGEAALEDKEGLDAGSEVWKSGSKGVVGDMKYKDKEKKQTRVSNPVPFSEMGVKEFSKWKAAQLPYPEFLDAGGSKLPASAREQLFSLYSRPPPLCNIIRPVSK
jgi:hypothetical protein